MSFEFLKFGVRVEQRVEIIETGYITDTNHIIFHPINPAAAVGFRIRRKTECVNDATLDEF